MSTASDLDRLDAEEVRRFLKRRWKLVAAVALGCALTALATCLMLRPIYTATAQVLLDPRRQHVFGQDAVQPDAALDSAIVDSQISIITSTRLLAKVITKENLAADPEFAGTGKPGLISRFLALFRPAAVRDGQQPALDGIDPALAPVIINLFNRIEVTRIAKSYVLSLSVSSRDAGKATRLANSLAATFSEDRVDVHARSLGQAAAFFEDRLGSLRDQVRASERAVADFRKAHGLTTTTLDGKITVGELQLQHLNEQLALAATDTAEKLARYQQAAQFTASGANLDTLPEVIRSPVITQLRGQQADLARRESDLSSLYGPAYPAITEVRAQKQGLDRAVAGEIRRLVSTLRNDHEVASARELALRKTIAGLSDVAGGDNETGVQLRELERTRMANQALFENFLNRAKITQEQSSFEEPDARLISPALEPLAPSFPKTKLIVPVAAVAGLILGLGAAALADGFARPDAPAPPGPEPAPGPERPDAARFVLGYVPRPEGRRAGAEAVGTVGAGTSDPAFKRAVAALAARLSEHGSRALALAAPGEGADATGLALALAGALALQGRRVLLVDADRAGRRLSRHCGADEDVGLGEVLRRDVAPAAAVLARAHFALLPAGNADWDEADPATCRALFAETRARFDLVLVDAPVDACRAEPLRGALDGTVLVANWDELARETFVAAVDAAAQAHAFLGIVLVGEQATDELALAG